MSKFKVCYTEKMYFREEVEAPTLEDAIRQIEDSQGAEGSESYDLCFEGVNWEETCLACNPEIMPAEIPPKPDWMLSQAMALQQELLNACQMVLSASEDGGDMEDIEFDQLRKVVAKATGGRK